jgi:nicotinamidase-related amidase
MNKYTEPHFSRSALITIDTQNDFTLDDAPAFISGTKEIIANMMQLLEAYRSQGWPIIHVVRLYSRDGSNADLCRKAFVEGGQQIVAPGTEGAELVQGLKPDSAIKLDPNALLSGDFQKIGPNEYIMYKPRWGAFYQTGLEAFLNEHDIDTLVFSGCNFPNCPRTSIYEASERDFRIVLVSDAISQLYPRGEKEMISIGVGILLTQDVKTLLAKTSDSCV